MKNDTNTEISQAAKDAAYHCVGESSTFRPIENAEPELRPGILKARQALFELPIQRAIDTATTHKDQTIRNQQNQITHLRERFDENARVKQLTAQVKGLQHAKKLCDDKSDRRRDALEKLEIATAQLRKERDALEEEAKIAHEGAAQNYLEIGRLHEVIGLFAARVFGLSDNLPTDQTLAKIEEAATVLRTRADRYELAHKMFSSSVVELLQRCQNGESTCIFTAQVIENEISVLQSSLNAATCEVLALRGALRLAMETMDPSFDFPKFQAANSSLNRTAVDYAHLVAVPREEWEALELARDCLGELAKLVTNDDGIDPEAFHIELTREQAYQIKMADENRAAMAADKGSRT